MAAFGDQLDKQGTQWQMDHVFEVQVWFSMSTIETDNGHGGTITRTVKNYDPRYWVVLSFDAVVNRIRNNAACQIVGNRETGALSKNGLTNAEYANFGCEPVPMGAAFWLGKPVT